MNLNQLTIIGFIGRNAETRQRPNGSLITKFSVATTKSWKDDNGEWKNKTQWHTVCGFGQGFAQMTPRLLKGTLVFVQGELSTREYERAIRIPTGRRSIEHVIQQIAVELKAETIRILDRAGNSDQSDAAEPAAEEEAPA
jgi:single-strand DNA-binding protein